MTTKLELAAKSNLNPLIWRVLDEEGQSLTALLPFNISKQIRPYLQQLTGSNFLSETLPENLRQTVFETLVERLHLWLPSYVLKELENDFLTFLSNDEAKGLQSIISAANQNFFPIEKPRSQEQDQAFQSWLTDLSNTMTPAMLNHVRRWIELKQLADESSVYVMNQLDPENYYNPRAAYRLLMKDFPDPEKRWAILQGQAEETLTGHPTNADDTTFLRTGSDLAEALFAYLMETDSERFGSDRHKIKDAVHRLVEQSPHTEKRPPEQEIREGIWFCERLYYGITNVTENIYGTMQTDDPELYARAERELFPLTPAIIRFWIGADADGNPKIDDKVTAYGVAETRKHMPQMYLNSVGNMIDAATKAGEISVRTKAVHIQRKLTSNHYPTEQFIFDVGEIYFASNTASLKNNARKLISRARAMRDCMAMFDTRQEPAVHADIVRGMTDFESLKNLSEQDLFQIAPHKNDLQRWSDVLSDKKANHDTVDKVLSEVYNLPETVLRILLDATERYFANQNVDPDPRLATVRRLALFRESSRKNEDDTWAKGQFDQYTISNCGEVWGMVNDVHTVQIMARAAGIENMLRVVPLVETRRALEQLEPDVKALLQQDWFLRNLTAHGNELRVEVAMSDTMRAHGNGIFPEQNEAGVKINLAAMWFNKHAGKEQPITSSVYYGLSIADRVRGGGDPTTIYYNLSRQTVAAGHMAGYSHEEIAQAISPNLQQTRQGRDCYYLLGSPRRAQQHLNKTVTGVWHYLSYINKEKTLEELNELVQERISTLKYQEWCKPVVQTYEGLFGPLWNHILKNISPQFVYGVNNINNSSRGERQVGFDSVKAFVGTKVRAISSLIFGDKFGLNPAGFAGYSALALVPEAELREVFQTSPIARQHMHNLAELLDKADLSSMWRELNQTPPDAAICKIEAEKYQAMIALPHEEQAKIVATAQESISTDRALARAGLCWYQADHSAVSTLLARVIHGPEFLSLQATNTLSYSPLAREETDSINAVARLLRYVRHGMEQSPIKSEAEKQMSELAVSRCIHAASRLGAFATTHNHGFKQSVASAIKYPGKAAISSPFRSFSLRRSRLANPAAEQPKI